MSETARFLTVAIYTDSEEVFLKINDLYQLYRKFIIVLKKRTFQNFSELREIAQGINLGMKVLEDMVKDIQEPVVDWMILTTPNGIENRLREVIQRFGKLQL